MAPRVVQVDGLDEHLLQDKLLRCVTNLQTDAEPSIRTNATILLGKLACRVKAGVCWQGSWCLHWSGPREIPSGYVYHMCAMPTCVCSICDICDMCVAALSAGCPQVRPCEPRRDRDAVAHAKGSSARPRSYVCIIHMYRKPCILFH